MGIAKSLNLAPCLAILLAACASQPSGQTYSSSETRTAMNVDYGEVVEVRVVKIEGYSTGIGTMGGASVGHAVGAAGAASVGGSFGGIVVASMTGVAGAVAGSAIERKLREDEALEITVKMDNARTIAIVQAGDVIFEPGDRVRVVFGPDGSARVTSI
jgi:outer membrane lipoprotein SlyB